MEIKEYLKRQNELLERLTRINTDDYKTKKSIIQQLIDVTRPLVETGYYNWKKRFFASFIHDQLLEYQIDYPRNQAFYLLFEDDEKREEGTNFESTNGRLHEHKFVDTDDDKIKRCECDAIQFETLIYDIMPPEEKQVSQKSDSQKSEKPDPYSNPYTEYIQRVKFNCDELGAQCNDFIKKYYSDENIAKTMESALPKTDSLLEEQKGVEAKLIHMGKQSDYRQKIGEFEKIKSIILCKSTYNLAKVAKMLSITPKHQSHNVLSSLDKYLTNLKWFRSIVFRCKKCQAENAIELADWYNEQVERKTLGLDMIDPT